jgi:hypothetical protein
MAGVSLMAYARPTVRRVAIGRRRQDRRRLPRGQRPRPPQRRARELIGNFLWLSAARVLDIVVIVVAIAVTVLMGRHLGPDQYGELTYVVGLSTIFVAIARVGIDQISRS